MTETENPITRREAVRTVVVGGTTVVVPAFAQVVRGATNSGYVEVKTTATIPTNTAIDIRVYEDLDGSGSANNQQENSIPDGTDEITQFSALDGTEASGVVYWFGISLSTSDDTTTPKLDTMTITLPEEDTDNAETADESQGIFDLFDNFLAFVAITVMGAGALGGLGSRSMAIGAFSAYLVFAHIAVSTGEQLLTNILYVTLVLVMLGMAFKLWRLELGGSGE